MNPLVYAPVVRALFRALDAVGYRGPRAAAKPLSPARGRDADSAGISRMVRDSRRTAPVADDDVSTRLRTGLGARHRDDRATARSARRLSASSPRWTRPVTTAPAFDSPEIAVPLATHTGWNYRRATIGAPDRLASEIGSYFPLPRTRLERERLGRQPSVDRRALCQPGGVSGTHRAGGSRSRRRAISIGGRCSGNPAASVRALTSGAPRPR